MAKSTFHKILTPQCYDFEEGQRGLYDKNM